MTLVKWQLETLILLKLNTSKLVVLLIHLYKYWAFKLSVVVYSCHPSYSEGRSRRIKSTRLAREKVGSLYLKNKIQVKALGTWLTWYITCLECTKFWFNLGSQKKAKQKMKEILTSNNYLKYLGMLVYLISYSQASESHSQFGNTFSFLYNG
jgi:hypothetical protein